MHDIWTKANTYCSLALRPELCLFKEGEGIIYTVWVKKIIEHVYRVNHIFADLQVIEPLDQVLVALLARPIGQDPIPFQRIRKSGGGTILCQGVKIQLLIG